MNKKLLAIILVLSVFFTTNLFADNEIRLGLHGDDFAVLRVDTSSFASLSKPQRLFAFRLYNAAWDGDPILYLQNHPQALRIRTLLQTLLDYGQSLNDYTTRGLVDYLAYIFINHGNYGQRTGKKIIPNFLTSIMLREAMNNAVRHGARLDFIPGSDVKAKFNFLFPYIFDPRTQPRLVVSEAGKDVVKDSAIGIYDPGLTTKDINALPKKDAHCGICRFINENGVARAERFGVNGAYSKYAKLMQQDLEQAFLFCPDESEKRVIKDLIDFLGSGNEDTYKQAWADWVKTNPKVDFVLGLVEQIKDPRGIVGFFEGAVWQKRAARTVKAITESAKYFEARMPWEKRFMNPNPGVPTAVAADCIVGTGEMGPVPWAGFNLPNYADVRAKNGSKNVMFLNIMLAAGQDERRSTAREFYLRPYQRPVLRYGKKARELLVYLHEIIGHGSGRPDPALKIDPRKALGTSYPPLEEARADLAALYQMPDPAMAGIAGIHPREVKPLARTMLVQYLTSALIMHRRLSGGKAVEAHFRASLLVLNFLTKAGDFGVRLEKQGMDYFIAVSDFDKAHKGLGKLLAGIQRIEGTADVKAARALLKKYATYYDADIKRNMSARARRIHLPKQHAFIFPDLVPVMKDNSIDDIKLVYPDFMDLLFRGYRTGKAPAWLKTRVGPNGEKIFANPSEETGK